MPTGVGAPWFAAISHGYGLRAGMQQLPNKHGSLRAALSSSVVSIQARPDKNSPRDDGHAENRPGTRRGACGTRRRASPSCGARYHTEVLARCPDTAQKSPCGIRHHTNAPMWCRVPRMRLHATSGHHTNPLALHQVPHKCSRAVSRTTFKFRAAVFYHTKNSCGTSASTIDGINYLNLHFCR